MQNFCSTVRIESRTYHDPHILNVYKWTIKAPRWVNYRYWICLTLTLISTTNCKFRKRKRHNLKCSRFAAQVRQRGKVQKKKKAEAQCPFPVHMLQHRSIQRVTLTMMARAVHIMSWTVERVYRAKFLNKPILCLSQDNFYLAVKADITRGQERAQIDDDLSGRTGRKPSKELLPFCRACSGQVAAGSNSSILVCMASVSASSSPGASPGNMTSSRSQMWLLVCRDALSMVLLLAP